MVRHNIIRIEHPQDGNGLWNTSKDGVKLISTLKCYKDLSARHMNPSKFPNLWYDPKLNNLSINYIDYYFAFKSLAQLEEAVDREWLKEILENGWKVLMLDVTDFFESDYQVIFKKSSIISSKDISSIFK